MISIRSSLKTSACAVAFLSLIACAHTTQKPDSTSQAPAPLAVKHVNLDIPTTESHPGSAQNSCKPLPVAQQAAAVSDINYAFSLIPEKAWKKINLRQLTLCSEITAKGKQVGSVVDTKKQQLALTVGEEKSVHRGHLVLHELYRYIEQRMEGSEDKKWNKRFKGYTMRYSGNDQYSYIGSGGKGFMNNYAKTFPHEDRAELFSSMLLEPLALQIYVKEHNDSVMLKKVVYMNEKVHRLLGFKILKRE